MTLKPPDPDLNFSSDQLMAQKNELIAMVEELSFLENKLRQSESALKNAQQIAHLGSWTLDPAKEQITVSDEMISIYGLNPAQNTLSFSALKEFVHPDDRPVFDATIQKCLEIGTDYELELRVIRADGEQRTILSRGHVQRRDKGDGIVLVATSQDITERKRAEEALFHANRKLNMLSSITRHDVLNKLTALYSFLELSQEASEGNPTLKKYVKKELEIATAIQRQIEFTRFYEDIGVRAPEWQEVGGIVTAAAAQLKPEGVELKADIPRTEIFADPLIAKVFYNLMENSLRHGGNVRSISISSHADDQGLTLYYQDNGCGIPDDDKKNLFRKGFGKHTGLGLFLSREILAITGIGIVEDGIPGKGVRFCIHVPKGAYRIADPQPSGNKED